MKDIIQRKTALGRSAAWAIPAVKPKLWYSSQTLKKALLTANPGLSSVCKLSHPER